MTQRDEQSAVFTGHIIPSLATLYRVAELELFESQGRGFKHGHGVSSAAQPASHNGVSCAKMKEFYNTWRADVGSWMGESTLARYHELVDGGQRQAAHQLSRSAFARYLFQLGLR